MPIKTRIHDNTSTIYAKAGCDITDKRLEALIKEETIERKEADTNLQAQIDEKQDRIEFIRINSLLGVLDREMLNLLIKNQVNRIVFGNTIYYLSIVEGTTIRKYFSKIQTSEFNEVAVNIETGEYEVKSKMDPVIKAHIENREIHITEEERLFWNNKVTATAQENSNDYTLLLSKD